MMKICLRVDMEDEKCKRRMMKCIAGMEGVESVAVDMRERKITVIGDPDPVYVVVKLRKLGFRAELLSVDSVNDKKVGSKCDTENRGSNHYVGSKCDTENRGSNHYVGSKCDTENRGSNHYLGVQRAEAVGGFGSMNRAIEDIVGSKTRIAEAVAGFGDFTSIEVDIQKGMVTVVGKSVPVIVALKVREIGYRAKLLSLGPATEEEDTDEEHNDDPYPTGPPYPFHVVEENPNRCTIA